MVAFFKTNTERDDNLTDILFNGAQGRDIRVLVAQRPGIPAPKPQYTALEIPGRDGAIVQKTGSYDDMEIQVEFHFATPSHLWHDTATALRRWLLSDGDGRLVFGDDKDWFYKVKLATLDKTSRELATVGKATATFLCDPYKYRTGGDLPHSPELCRYNPYDTCHPIYCISYSGKSYIYVNGKSVTVDYDGTIYLDSDLMIAYGEEGENLNACVTGDYEDLWLYSGRNGLAGYYNNIQSITPNWRLL